MKIVINPLLIIYYDPSYSSLAIVDPIHKRHFTISDTYWIMLLKFVKKAKTEKEIQEYLIKENIIDTASLAVGFIKELLEQNILIKRTSKIKKLIKQRDNFRKYNWESAFMYHVYSRDYPFLDYSKIEHSMQDISLMEEYSKKWPPPPIFKEERGKTRIKLIDDKKMDKLKFPLVKNRKAGSLDLNSISTLFYLCFGQVGSVHFKVTGKAILRTSPSGGARHPTEAYFINLKVKNIPVGVYHYSVKNNELVLINKVDMGKSYMKTFYQLNHVPEFKPKAIIVLTSLAERSMWRYREARSFRVLFFDMGHIMATIRVTAESLGLGMSIGDGFSERLLKPLLGLEGIDEQPFSFIAIK